MIDLHAHSHASDGCLSPTALVDYAVSRKISVLALTDHDCTDGIAEAEVHANKQGIRLIPGLELSVLWGNYPLHIIGLDISPSDEALMALLDKQFKARYERAERIAKQLETFGLEAVFQKANKLAQNGLITRPHFAQVLINEGLCKDMKSAFKRYLKRGRPAYVRVNWVSMEEGIRIIRGAGGIPIIAHPMRYGLTNTKLQCLLGDFKAQGGLAVEVVSGISSDTHIAKMAALSRDYDLMASVGSDFHGPERTPTVMGNLKPLPKLCQLVLDAIDGEDK